MIKLKLLKSYFGNVFGVMSIRMIVNVVINHFVSYIATRRAKIPSCPKVSAPINFLQARKFLLYLARRTAFGLLNKITLSNVRRYRYKQMHMIARHHSVFYINPQLFSNLGHNVSNTLLYLRSQYLITILRDPNYVVSVIVNRMMPFPVYLHTIQYYRVLNNVETKVFPSGRRGFQPSKGL